MGCTGVSTPNATSRGEPIRLTAWGERQFPSHERISTQTIQEKRLETVIRNNKLEEWWLYLSEHVWGGLHLEGGLAEAAPYRYRSKLRALKKEGSQLRPPHPLHNRRNWQNNKET